jgi:hypothetical protein
MAIGMITCGVPPDLRPRPNPVHVRLWTSHPYETQRHSNNLLSGRDDG